MKSRFLVFGWAVWLACSGACDGNEEQHLGAGLGRVGRQASQQSSANARGRARRARAQMHARTPARVLHARVHALMRGYVHHVFHVLRPQHVLLLQTGQETNCYHLFVPNVVRRQSELPIMLFTKHSFVFPSSYGLELGVGFAQAWQRAWPLVAACG